jgi:2-methylisocitrate lyase-like PEP mutase family enzyme
MNRPRALRDLLARGGQVVAPGAYDGFTARLVEQAGFPAIHMTGGGVSYSLGYPDYGLTTMTEMVDAAGRMSRAVDVPIIADADTGYGNELNMFRAVGEFESRGVAAIHVEDQEFPKRCGHVAGKTVVALDEYLPKIRAAAAARRNPDFMIIARTDAIAVHGFDEAIVRANAALAAGADMAFVEAPRSMQEVAAVPRRVNGPCLINIAYGGQTPPLDMRETERLGYRIAIVPGVLTKTVMQACEHALRELRTSMRHPVGDAEMQVAAFFDRFDAKDWDARRTLFRGDRADTT